MNNYIGLSEGQFLLCWPPSHITEKLAPLFLWNIKVQTYVSEKDSQKDVSSFQSVQSDVLCYYGSLLRVIMSQNKTLHWTLLLAIFTSSLWSLLST